MKVLNFKPATALLLLFIMATACDEIDDLTEFDINESFTTTFNVNIPENENEEELSFTESSIIDLGQVQEINDNLDFIQNVTVNSISFEITNFSGAEDADLTNVTLAFGTRVISFSNIGLQEADTNNTLYTIDDAADLSAISNALESNPVLSVELSAGITNTPAVFDVVVTVDAKVTIDVI